MSDENIDSIPFTHEELCEPSRLYITEEALIHEPLNYNKMQTRSQTKNKNVYREILSQEEEDEIKEMEDKNDPPDKEKDIEENIDDEDQGSGNHKNNNNQGLRIKIAKDNK